MRTAFVVLAALAAGCAAPSPAAEAPGPGGPRITAIRPRRTGESARIRIEGRGLARPGEQTWLKFSPDLWIEAEDAAEDRIELNIPVGAVSGPVEVRVGRAPGNALPLEIARSFDTPPPAEAVVRDRDGFAVTTTSDLLVMLADFHGLDEAEALAARHGATLAGFLPSINLYTFRFPARTIHALLALEKTLREEPGVERVTLALGLRPR